MKVNLLCGLVLVTILGGCYPELIPPPQGRSVRGWTAVYVQEDAARRFTRNSPRSPGGGLLDDFSADSTNTLFSGAYAFKLDSLVGVEVYFRDEANARSSFIERSFLVIPGANAVSGRPDSLVVNNLDDLLVLDASTADDVRLVARRAGEATFTFPGDRPGTVAGGGNEGARTGYFDCPDNARGVLLGWQEGFSANYECYLQ